MGKDLEDSRHVLMWGLSCSLLVMHDPKEEGITIIQNVGKYLPFDMA
jgi:hypothetical protein